VHHICLYMPLKYSYLLTYLLMVLTDSTMTAMILNLLQQLVLMWAQLPVADYNHTLKSTNIYANCKLCHQVREASALLQKKTD